MQAQIAPLAERQAWKELAAHYQKVRDVHLRKLFADDSNRGERLTAEAVGLFLITSKNRITNETLKLLLRLAGESGLRACMDAMFRGEKINVTEKKGRFACGFARAAWRINCCGWPKRRCPRSTLCSTR